MRGRHICGHDGGICRLAGHAFSLDGGAARATSRWNRAALAASCRLPVAQAANVTWAITVTQAQVDLIGLIGAWINAGAMND
jgi:hypothetical protein